MSNNYSTDLEESSSQYFSITDSNLSSGFPGKSSGGSSSELTVEFWVKFETTSNQMGIVNKYGTDRSFQIQYLNDGRWNVTTNNNSGGNDGKVFTSGAEAGIWIHVAWTWKGSTKEFKIYEDGTQIGSTLTGSEVSSLGLISVPLTIGAFSSTSYPLDGLLNNVRVWSVVRTQSQIDDNKEKILSDETGLEGSWFNETNDGDDLTSNSNDLTNNNSATFSDDVPFEELEPTHVANITIDHTKVDADLTDFPIYIDLSDLPDSFWDVVANGGGDIRIYKEDGTTQLAREVVSCDTGAKTGEMHLNYDGTLSSSSDITIQVWADGSSSEPASDSTYGSEAVWGSDYKAVWHMNATSGGETDSTANNNNLSDNNTVGSGAGQIGNARDFKATDNEYLSIIDADQTGLDIAGDWSLNYWFKLDQLPSSAGFIFNFYYRNTEDDGMIAVQFTTDDKLFARYQDASGATITVTDGVIVDFDDVGEWVHLAISVDVSAQSFVIKKNSNNQSNTLIASNATSVGQGSATLYISSQSGYQRYVDGLIDEMLFLDTTLSAGWISTEYNNQSSPSTFYTASEPSPATNTTNFFNFF